MGTRRPIAWLFVALLLGGCTAEVARAPAVISEGPARDFADAAARGVSGSSSEAFDDVEAWVSETDLVATGRVTAIEPGERIDGGEDGDRATLDFMWVVVELDDVIAGSPDTRTVRFDVPVPTDGSADQFDRALPDAGFETLIRLYSASRYDEDAPADQFVLPNDECFVLATNDGEAVALGGQDVATGDDFDGLVSELRRVAAG